MSDAAASDPFPGLSPADIARRSAATMWATDQASQGLEIEILSVGPGIAELAMTVGPQMTNGFGSAHGGFLFTLADSAFAYACNSYGLAAVAAQCSIHYLAPGKLGDRLVASAREVARSGRSGIYDVRIHVGDRTIAEFRGTSRTIGGPFIDATPTVNATS